MNKFKKPLIAIIFAVFIFAISFLTKISLSGTYLSLGDALIMLAACFLPTGYALLAALLGYGSAALAIGGVGIVLYILPIRLLIACWFIDTGDRLLDSRNLIGVVASAIILIGGGYISDMARLGDLAAPVANMPFYAVAAGANIVLFFILAFLCDLLKLRPRLMAENKPQQKK